MSDVPAAGNPWADYTDALIIAQGGGHFVAIMSTSWESFDNYREAMLWLEQHGAFTHELVR